MTLGQRAVVEDHAAPLEVLGMLALDIVEQARAEIARSEVTGAARGSRLAQATSLVLATASAGASRVAGRLLADAGRHLVLRATTEAQLAIDDKQLDPGQAPNSRACHGRGRRRSWGDLRDRAAFIVGRRPGACVRSSPRPTSAPLPSPPTCRRRDPGPVRSGVVVVQFGAWGSAFDGREELRRVGGELEW